MNLENEIVKTAVISLVSMGVGGFITWRTVKTKIDMLCESLDALKVKVEDLEKKQNETQIKTLEELGRIRETVARIDERLNIKLAGS